MSGRAALQNSIDKLVTELSIFKGKVAMSVPPDKEAQFSQLCEDLVPNCDFLATDIQDLQAMLEEVVESYKKKPKLSTPKLSTLGFELLQSPNLGYVLSKYAGIPSHLVEELMSQPPLDIDDYDEDENDDDVNYPL